MSHPLQGALDRINRAQQHLADFEGRQSVFGQDYHDSLVIEFDANKDNKPVIHPGKPVYFDRLFGILVGEIVYNLRAALDYLVYELAIKDTGHIQDGTQFPICDEKRTFDGVQGKFLVGLNPAHRAAIESLQPYRGCDWTPILRDISNPDKHRRLTAPSHSFAVRMSTMPSGRGLMKDFGTAPIVRSVRRTVHPSVEREVDVYLSSEAPIIIDVGGRAQPVVKTMKYVKARVTETLEAFKPEF
jgi:hypothetical protein